LYNKMEEYSSNNTNLILKKSNYILDKVNLSLQNRYHKEGFNKNQTKFKTANETMFAEAIQYGYIFIPGLRFKSIIEGDPTKHIIDTKILSLTQSVGQLLNDTNKTTEGLDKTIAVYYTGQNKTVPRTMYFLRQFWYEDIEEIPYELKKNNPLSGIFIRKLEKINEIIDSAEDLSNYEWINNGYTNLGNSPNNITRTEIYNDTDKYNMFDNLYFLILVNQLITHQVLDHLILKKCYYLN